jgi:hypothetical protein
MADQDKTQDKLDEAVLAAGRLSVLVILLLIARYLPGWIVWPIIVGLVLLIVLGLAAAVIVRDD